MTWQSLDESCAVWAGGRHEDGSTHGLQQGQQLETFTLVQCEWVHGSGVNLAVSSHRTVLKLSVCISFCSRQKKTPGLHLVCHTASQSLIYTCALMSLKKKMHLAKNSVRLQPQHRYPYSLSKPLWDIAEVDWSQQKDGHWFPESLGCDVWAVWGFCWPDIRALIKKGEKNNGWKRKIHNSIRVSLSEGSQDYLKGVLFLFVCFLVLQEKLWIESTFVFQTVNKGPASCLNLALICLARGAAGRSDWSIDYSSGSCGRGQFCHTVLQSVEEEHLCHGPLTGVCLVDPFPCKNIGNFTAEAQECSHRDYHH